MSDIHTRSHSRGGKMRIPRSRGALSGFLLILLGLWGALIPFVGPYFDFAFSPDRAWAWSAGRGWLEVLPGAVAVLGGLLLLLSKNRATAMFGSWLAVAAGAWFVIGRAVAGPLGLGDPGTPLATGTKELWLELTYFYGLGALVVFLGAAAMGRLSIRSVRDIEYAHASGARVVEQPGEQPTDTGEQRADSTGQPTGAGESATDTQKPAADAEGETHRRSWRDLLPGHRGDRTLAHH